MFIQQLRAMLLLVEIMFLHITLQTHMKVLLGIIGLHGVLTGIAPYIGATSGQADTAHYNGLAN